MRKRVFPGSFFNTSQGSGGSDSALPLSQILVVLASWPVTFGLHLSWQATAMVWQQTCLLSAKDNSLSVHAVGGRQVLAACQRKARWAVHTTTRGGWAEG